MLVIVETKSKKGIASVLEGMLSPLKLGDRQNATHWPAKATGGHRQETSASIPEYLDPISPPATKPKPGGSFIFSIA